MSADLWIESPACEACGRQFDGAELNVTYNLSKMLREAGFEGWRWCVDRSAQEVGKHMLAVLDGMRADEDRWRAMNPANGWGNYDACLQSAMRTFAYECLAAPAGSTIGASL